MKAHTKWWIIVLMVALDALGVVIGLVFGKFFLS